MKKNKIKTDLFTIALLVMVLVLASLYMVTGILAKYKTSGAIGDDAEVAVFDVSLENPLVQTFDVTMYPMSSQQTLTVNVTNDSEVTMMVFIKFEATGNLPIEIIGTSPLQQDSEDSNLWYYISTPLQGTFQLNSLVGWISGANGYEYNGGVEHITLTVYAEQVD